ncbi:hypothetical protein HDV01_007837 [Terramyces sp. JEL0728]|nr:hypothetical protein HDV01_007837 [Terramyces sp. JEL0728]
MLSEISNELSTVGHFLPIQDYQHLRLSFRNSLPLQQQINPAALDAAYLTKSKKDFSSLITIHSNYITETVILDLFKYKLYELLTRKEYTIPEQYVAYFMFEITLGSHLNQELVLKLIPMVPIGTAGFERYRGVGSLARAVKHFNAQASLSYLLARVLTAGYTRLAKRLLSTDFKVIDWFPFHITLYRDDLILLALEQVQIKSNLGIYNVLEYPVTNGMLSTVQAILSKPGITFLSKNIKLAFSLGFNEIVLEILKYKEFNMNDILGYELDLFEFVFGNIPIADEFKQQVFNAAIEKNSRVFDALFSSVDLLDNNSECLRTACSTGNVEFVTRLLNDGRVDPDHAMQARKWHPGLLELFLANPKFSIDSNWIVQHCLDIHDLKVLLNDKRINPVAGNHLLKYAADRSDYEMFKLLIALDFDFAVDNHYVFRRLVTKKARECLELLISHPRFKMELPIEWLEKNGLNKEQ